MKNCQLIAQMLIPAGVSLLLPQYEERVAGLLYVCSGSGTLTGAAGPLPVKAGAAAVYSAWRSHQLAAQENISFLFCAFSAGQEEPVPARLIAFHPPQPQLNELMRALTHMAEAVRDLPGRAEAEPADIPLYVRSARRIIDSCYGESLTLDELSARVGRSKYHLSRAFRECYEVTPGAYLITVRLTRAKELLAETNLPVREIGERVGFPNNAYFTSLFKKRFGCPPGEYRMLQRNRG